MMCENTGEMNGVFSMKYLERLIEHLAQYGKSSTSIVLSTPVTRRIVEVERDQR
jgi:hypothetical protein